MVSEESRRLRTAYSTSLRDAYMREGYSYDDDKDFVTRPYWPLEPKNAVVPHLWKWNQTYELTKRAGEMIGLGRGGKKYDRRVLALINPGLRESKPEQFSMSGPLFGDIQLIQPGEEAPSHRHTPCATRFILAGEGGWTSVAGQTVQVKPGDVVYTGQFPWHHHGNKGQDDFIFLDVLDIPLLQFTATSAWEFDTEIVHNPRPEDFGHLKLADARRSLEEMENETGCLYDGIRREWNSANGGPIGRTVSVYTQMLRGNEKTLSHRHTGSSIYVATGGSGVVRIENQTFEFERNDIFVIPSWHWHSFENHSAESCFLNSINEISLICKMGLYREQRKASDGRVLDSGWRDSADLQW